MTTSEKINQCCIWLDELRDKIDKFEEELQTLRSDNSKPPDLEPLKFGQVLKDAARYQKYKELLAQAAEGWEVLPDPDNLDQQLDDAME